MIFVELLGRGYLSINYETPITSRDLISFGIGWNKLTEARASGDQATFSCPLLHAQYIHLIGNGRSFFEIGGGFTYAFTNPERLCGPKALNKFLLSLGAVVGYRHLITKDFMFRAGFTPSSHISDTCWPILGLSLGYKL